MDIAEIYDLINSAEEYFEGHLWLNDLRDAMKKGEYAQDENGDILLSLNNDPGIEICGVCGCGRSDLIQRFYHTALHAIKARVDDIQGKNIEEILKKYNKDLIEVFSKAIDGKLDGELNTTTFKFCNDELLEEVVLHFLDYMGYTEHGSSIYGSWLSEKGEVAMKALDLQFCDGEEEKGEE